MNSCSDLLILFQVTHFLQSRESAHVNSLCMNLQKIFISVFTVLTLKLSEISHIKGPMISWKTGSAEEEELKVDTVCSVKNMMAQAHQIIYTNKY